MSGATAAATAAPSRAQQRRLREIWRSAGWPCCDTVEIELLAAGWLERVRDAAGRETLRVTEAGVQVMAAGLAANRRAFDAHEALVGRVAREMQRAGRIVWRGLALRAPLASREAIVAAGAANGGCLPGSLVDGPAGEPPPALRWAMAMPDVFSIRHTTVEDYAEPVVHEVKVRRADLLADLRRADKGAAYAALASQCWYVLKAGIADPDEVPAAYGVLIAHPGPQADGGGREALAFGALELVRPAPKRPMRVPFAVWMALARATPVADDDDGQQPLGAPATG